MDYGAIFTERERRILYRRLQRQYREAQKNIRKKLNDFLAGSAQREKLYQQKVEAGLLTQEFFDNWKEGQVFIGKRWGAKLDEITGTLTEANKKALAMVRGEQYKVFAENANYQAYGLEKDGQKHNVGVSFDIYDEATVRRLIQEKPELLKRSTLNSRKDKAWNQGIISNSITQGIIQGESIPEIAERIARDTCDRNNTHMMLYARTAMTCAQNAGRIETMHRAADLGLHVKKEWIATLDSRTRDSHQHLDGQTAEVDEPFSSILGDIMFPGDPDAEPANVWNCRCTLGSVYVDFESDGKGTRRDNETGEEIEDMTYDEWKEWKEEQNQPEPMKIPEPPKEEEPEPEKNTDLFGNELGKEFEMMTNEGDLISVYVDSEHDVYLPDGQEDGTSLGTADMIVYSLPDGMQIYYKKDMDLSKQDINPADMIRSYYDIPEWYRGLMQKKIEIVDYKNPQDDYWRKVYGNSFPFSYMNGGKAISIWGYTGHNYEYITQAFIHEGGHYIDRFLLGEYSATEEWKNAMGKDKGFNGLLSPTQYGRMSDGEDFAESCMKFVLDEEYLKVYFPNRYEILKRMFGVVR